MKTHVLFGIVAFLVRPIWVLLAKAGCILRLLVRVEAHPRTPLRATLQVHSAATPSLGAAERTSRGGVAGVRTPVCYQRPGRLDSMRVGAVLKASPILLGPLAFRALVRRLQRR